MSWNYRVIKGSDCFKIFEVYYYDGQIVLWTEASSPFGETALALKEDLLMMLDAFCQPTLEKIGDELVEI